MYSTLIPCLLLWTSVNGADQQEEARKYLQRVNKLYAEKNHESALAEWAYVTNITKETLAQKVFIGVNYNRLVIVPVPHFHL